MHNESEQVFFQIIGCYDSTCCHSGIFYPSVEADNPGHCYEFLEPEPFVSALSACRQRGADLVTVKSNKIKDELKTLMYYRLPYSTFWIGGTSQRWIWEKEGTLAPQISEI